MKCGYSVGVGADISLGVGTTQSILGIRSNAAFGLHLKKVSLAARGSGSSAPTATPLLVEICHCTFATNGTAGTNNTSETTGIVQTYGRTLTHGMTAMSAWTSEPTALSILDEFALHPQQLMKEGLPFGEEYDCGLSEGFVMRVTNPAGNPTVTMRPMFHVERI